MSRIISYIKYVLGFSIPKAVKDFHDWKPGDDLKVKGQTGYVYKGLDGPRRLIVFYQYSGGLRSIRYWRVLNKTLRSQRELREVTREHQRLESLLDPLRQEVIKSNAS